MQLARPAFALHPKLFGKGRRWTVGEASPVPTGLSDDVRLFATTFVAGFLFVSILIG